MSYITLPKTTILGQNVCRILYGPDDPLGHWLHAHYDRNNNIYDCLNLHHLHEYLKDTLSEVYSYMPPVNFKHIQQQSNIFDFGVLAMIFATSLATVNKQ
jgi:hypothetical protein